MSEGKIKTIKAGELEVGMILLDPFISTRDKDVEHLTIEGVSHPPREHASERSRYFIKLEILGSDAVMALETGREVNIIEGEE